MKLTYLYIGLLLLTIGCEDPDAKKIKVNYPFIIESTKAVIDDIPGNAKACGKLLYIYVKQDKTSYYVKPSNIDLNNFSLAKTYSVKVKVLEEHYRCMDGRGDPIDGVEPSLIVNMAEVLEIK